MAVTISALTTIDNPHDPFDEWYKWYSWDEAHGYHSCGRLAARAHTFQDMPLSMYIDEVDRAITAICAEDSRYKRVTKEMQQ